MEIQLLKGHFSSSEAIELLAQLVEVKVKFHESKIGKSLNEEDIKMRETRIKQLQNDFFEAKKRLQQQSSVKLNDVIHIG